MVPYPFEERDPGVFVAACDLAELPSLALVAFTARCGRRVQPLYRLWAAADPEGLLAVDNALRSAEEFARGEVAAVDCEVSEAAYRAAAKAAVVARVAEADAADALKAAWAAAASHAASDAAIDTELDPEALPLHALFAERRSSEVARLADVAARRDFDRLCELALGVPGELGAPVDPSESGPLGAYWGDRSPEWWPSP